MNDTNSTETDNRDTLIDLQPYCDAELDEAMRELLAIEAAERDAVVIKQLHRRTLRLGTLAAWLTAVAVTLLPALASADEPRVKKPTLCAAGTVVSGTGFQGFLCTDGKRPKLFTRWTRVEFVDSEGEKASYVLGWTTVQPKAPKVAPVATLKL